MNERFKELAVEAGMILGDVSEFDMAKFMPKEVKFAEMIVRECADVAGRDVGHFVLKHFGVEEQSTEPNEWHTCPYAEEIHNDYETLCDCDEESTRQCAMDV